VSILHPRMQGESLRILLILYWRPRRDLNPCYRREIRSHGMPYFLSCTITEVGFLAGRETVASVFLQSSVIAPVASITLLKEYFFRRRS
jgi:hypothetical protein